MKIDYYETSALDKIPIVRPYDDFGLIVSKAKIYGVWESYRDTYQPILSVRLTGQQTLGTALPYFYKQGNKLTSAYVGLISTTGDPFTALCICLGSSSFSDDGDHCYTTPVCSADNPDVIQCNIPATVEISHSATQPGRDSVANKQINVNCTQPGNVMLSLTNSTVNLGGGITSSLSMNVGQGGLFPVIKGNTPLTITSNLHVPSGTSPGNYQGSTTLKLEYP
ncbi:fimbrial protein [Serratia ficaria]|uniref:hypothetical protein n=1 Tax=Serratia ficaria TaxID=61651 RepID=UPI0021BDE939|nr:hypothetical protein [Serratia ficaria]